MTPSAQDLPSPPHPRWPRLGSPTLRTLALGPWTLLATVGCRSGPEATPMAREVQPVLAHAAPKLSPGARSIHRPHRGTEIIVCGQRFDIGTPVVTWLDPGGYDAYRVENRFGPTPGSKPGDPPRPTKARYDTWRGDLPEALVARVKRDGWTVADLAEVVHLFVLHYDVAGTSRQCFKILQDMRDLSVHFMLDVDGTIYQTLDLKERARHATIANNRGVGIEIAHPGAYPAPGHPGMTRFYAKDDGGVTYMKYPQFIGDPGVRTPDYVPYPDRTELLQGRIHGKEYWQRDFTTAQYEALAKLTAGLHAVLPRIRLDAPRTPEGLVRQVQVPAEELLQFEGVVGHFHVQRNKQDPGPAFQWDRVLRAARQHAKAHGDLGR